MVSQNMIINKILQTKDLSLVSLNGLNNKYFFNYKAEFDYIKNHYEQYGVVPDKLTFANIFPNFDFVDVAEPDTFLLEQLYNDYNTSYMVTCFNDIRKLIQAGETDKAKTLFENSYSGLQTGTVMTCTNLLEDVSRYDRYLERTTDRAKHYLTTGFDELDMIIGGLDRENENFVVVARPGQGKTQVLLKMATAASKAGLTVGIYEGEMSNDKVGYRIDTFLGHIKNMSINRGDIYVQKEYKDYINSLKTANLGPIKVFNQNDVPSGRVTVDTLKTFIEKEHIDVLFVDQYDLLDDKYYGKTEPERVSNITRCIKKLQVEKQIPIVSVSQMNRTKNEDGTQDTTQIAGSDKIGRYATVVIALEQKYIEETRTMQLILNVVKARDGGDRNKLVYNVDFNTGTFVYIPSANDGITSDEEFDNTADAYMPTANNSEAIF